MKRLPTRYLAPLLILLGVLVIVLHPSQAGRVSATTSRPPTATPAAHPLIPSGRLQATSLSAWSPATSTGTTATLNAVAGSGSGTWIAAGQSGAAIRSTDDGQTWRTITAISSGTTANLRAVAFASSTQVWIGGDQGVLYSSSDRGVTWSSQVVTDPSNGAPLFIYGIAFTSPTTAYLAGEEVPPPSLGFVGEIYRTTNGGATWQVVSTPNTTIQTWNGIVFNSSGVGLAVTGNNEIIRSTDGVNWTLVYNGGFLAGLEAVAFGPNGTTAEAVGTNNTLLQSTDSGVTWSPATTDTKSYTYFYGVAFVPTSSGLGGAVGQESGQVIVDTADAGATWSTAYADSASTSLNGVACSVSTCVAVGDSNVLRAATGLTPPPTPTSLPVIPRDYLPLVTDKSASP